jgi:hypothetical protein
MIDTATLARLIFLAGTAGTTLMTAGVLAVAAGTRQELNVLRILGTMLTVRTKSDGTCSRAGSTLAIGILAHYAVGYFFTIIYVWMWNNRYISDDLATTCVLGFITGVFGITVWRVFFALHRRPPTVPLKLYLTCICLSHILFAIGVRAVYTFMS